jgi:transposase
VIDDDVLCTVFPHLDGLTIDAVCNRGRVVQIVARTAAVEAGCPGCGVMSARVHGRYVRRLSDMAVGGREVVILLTVRRFRCLEDRCDRRTFAEQVRSVAGRYQRRTRLLRQVLSAVAVMLAGRAGARLAGRLRVATSRSSLLRLLRAVPEPRPGPLTAIGIDDFALRRGHVYGTVVIDMDTHRPVDVLPDRAAHSVADWLMAHPGIKVICRDRANSYAEGARAGAPTATQVADRWHLYKNLAEAVAKVVARYRHDLAEPDPASHAPDPDDAERVDPAATAGPDCAGTAEAVEESIAAQGRPNAEPVEPGGWMATRTIERHQAIHALLDAGRTRGQISKELGLDPHTVRRYANVSDVTGLIHPRRTYATILDSHKAHLHRRWNDGVTNAEQLHREIAAMGYLGSAKSVRRYLQPLRAGQDASAPKPPTPTIRQVTEWITRRPDDVTTDDTATLTAILTRCPALAATHTLVRDFAKMVTRLTGQHLPAWLNQVDRDGEPELRTFAAGLRKDLAAVTAGLTLPYSSGPVEGNVNRIKTIKRQMYGRASFDLLRHRILLAA